MTANLARLRALTSVAMAVAVGATVVVASPGRAGLVATAPVTLGIHSFGQIVVDPATLQIFISGPSENSIVVTDLTGNIVSTITGETGVGAMMLVGGTLYVALSTGAIDRIDTTTRMETSPLITGLVTPSALAYAHSLVWTTTNVSGVIKLVSIDPSAVTPSATIYNGIFNSTNGLSNCAAFATNHLANPSYLVAFRPCYGTASIDVLDVSGVTPVQTATASLLSFSDDVTVSADGVHVMATSSHEVDEYNLSDLTLDGVVYPAVDSVVAVDTTASNGSKVVGGVSALSFAESSIMAYPLGDPTQSLASAAVGQVVNRGAAISPDGLTAYLLTSDFYGIHLNLQSLPALAANGTPGLPTGVTATAGVGAAVISWTAPIYHGTSPITGYLVSSSGGATTTVGPTVFTTLLAGLSGVPHTFTVSAINSHGTGVPSVASNVVTPAAGGTLNILTPSRILDTRTGNGGFPIHRVPAGSTLSLQVTGRGGVPSIGVSAVVLNVTVTNTTGSGFVVAFPGGTLSRPLASNLNFTRGLTVPNLVEVGVGSLGNVELYVGGASADLVADVEGWVGDSTDSYGGVGLFNAMGPTRLYDSRQISTANGYVHQPLGPGQALTIPLTYSLPSPTPSAVVLNVTVTNPTQAGYVTVYPAGASRPLASNLNFAAGQTVPNRVIVGVGPLTGVTIYNGAGTVDVVVDINGWFTGAGGSTGSAFVTLAPYRLLDSRLCRCKLGPGYLIDEPLTGAPLAALSLNVTATNPTANSFLTVYPDDGTFGNGPVPLASDLNFGPSQTAANMTIVMIPADMAFNIFNGAGWTDVVVDVNGVYGPVATALVPGGLPFTSVVLREPRTELRSPTSTQAAATVRTPVG